MSPQYQPCSSKGPSSREAAIERGGGNPEDILATPPSIICVSYKFSSTTTGTVRGGKGMPGLPDPMLGGIPTVEDGLGGGRGAGVWNVRRREKMVRK